MEMATVMVGVLDMPWKDFDPHNTLQCTACYG